jgi:preprotein translocase subunit SecY
MVIFQQQKISENLQRQGAFIPGVRPGRNTQLYLQRTLNRITLIGALFLGAVAVMPFIAAQLTGVNSLLLGATSLLIVVGVAIDTMRQLEAQLVMRNYERISRIFGREPLVDQARNSHGAAGIWQRNAKRTHSRRTQPGSGCHG